MTIKQQAIIRTLSIVGFAALCSAIINLICYYIPATTIGLTLAFGGVCYLIFSCYSCVLEKLKDDEKITNKYYGIK